MKQLIEHLKKLPKDHLLHFTVSLLLAWTVARVACATTVRKATACRATTCWPMYSVQSPGQQ